MHEAFKEEDIVNKVGGRFKLSSLIQKRLVALNRGAPPLVGGAAELAGQDGCRASARRYQTASAT